MYLPLFVNHKVIRQNHALFPPPHQHQQQRFGLVFFVSHYKSYQKIIICSKVFIFIFF